MIALVLTPVVLIAFLMASDGMVVLAAVEVVVGGAVAWALSAVTHLEVDPESGLLRVRRVLAVFGRANDVYPLAEVRGFSTETIDESDLLALMLHHAGGSTRVCDGDPERMGEAVQWLKHHLRLVRKNVIKG